MATHHSIFAWESPWTRGAWQAAVHGVTELDMTEHTFMQKHPTLLGEGGSCHFCSEKLQNS